MPKASIHFTDEGMARVERLRDIATPYEGRRVSRSELIELAIAEYDASRAVAFDSQDTLTAQVTETERAIEALRRIRARSVQQLRARGRKHPGQTAITDPQPKETEQ